MKSVKKVVRVLTIGCLLGGPSGLAIAQTNGLQPIGPALSKNLAARAAQNRRKMHFVGKGDAFVDFAVPGATETTSASLAKL